MIPKAGFIPHFFTIIKQHGALFAKGRLLGIQFDELFTDLLYEHIGKSAVMAARSIQKALTENGYQLYFESPTNQIFCLLENTLKDELAQTVDFSFWGKYDDNHTIIRFATSWATASEDVEKLIHLLESPK